MNTTLKDLISSLTWREVEATLYELYPDEADVVRYYKRLFWDLSNSPAAENPSEAVIYLDLFDEEEEEYYEIDLYEETVQPYTTTLEVWQQYLGFYIDPELLAKLPPSEVLAHILVEFTYGGFEEEYAE